MAKVIVRGYEDEHLVKYTFTMLVGFGDILQTITNSEDITDQTLLDAESFNIGYNVYSVITSVFRARDKKPLVNCDKYLPYLHCHLLCHTVITILHLIQSQSHLRQRYLYGVPLPL